MFEKYFKQNVEKVCGLIKYIYLSIKITIIVHIIHHLSNNVEGKFGKVFAFNCIES